jgi:hypothetical protein
VMSLRFLFRECAPIPLETTKGYYMEGRGEITSIETTSTLARACSVWLHKGGSLMSFIVMLGNELLYKIESVVPGGSPLLYNSTHV